MTNTTMQAHGLTVPEPVSGQRSNRHAAAAVAALATALAWSAPAAADSDEYFRPVTDETVKTECSACHMAYPAGMLPARSWRALMGDLSNHFGEDASLPEETRAAMKQILAEIQSGEFAKEFIGENKAGNENFDRMRQEALPVVIGDTGEIDAEVEIARHGPGAVAGQEVDLPVG